MKKHMRKAALVAVLAMAGCKTTQAVGPEVGVEGPKVTQQTATNAADVQPQISSKAKLLFEDALKAYDAQKKAKTFDYVALEKKFSAAVDADSNLAEAEYNLGVLAEKQGKTQAAISHYKSALATRPTLKQAAENLAVIAQNSGDEKTAVQIYEDIQKNYPDDASSRARLGEIYRRKGDQEKALEMSREALFRDPKTIQAYKTMMLVHYEQKQYALAKLIALRASKIDEGDPEMAYLLGLISLQEKDTVKARAQFKKALDGRADFLPAHYQLVKMAFAQEDYQGAEEHLRKILQANGNNPEALMNLGVAYKGMGQLDKAMATYDEAQKLKPDMPELDLNRGIIIATKGDPEKAITLFRSYIQKKGGETAVGMEHPVLAMVTEQENVIKQREEDKKVQEEANKMEAEMKKQEDAAAAEEKAKKEAEFQKQKDAAKGGAAKGAIAPDGATETPPIETPKKDEPKKEEPKKEEAKKAVAPAPATATPAAAPVTPAPAKPKSADEPVDGL
jgi:Flp pilus assembly protein TadD